MLDQEIDGEITRKDQGEVRREQTMDKSAEELILSFILKAYKFVN